MFTIFLLSNSRLTFNLENVNLLRDPKIDPKNGVAIYLCVNQI